VSQNGSLSCGGRHPIGVGGGGGGGGAAPGKPEILPVLAIRLGRVLFFSKQACCGPLVFIVNHEKAAQPLTF